MRQRCFLLFLTFLYCVMLQAQPGPRYVNLNKGLGDVIIIDSTTNLSRIKILKNKKNIHLMITLPKIPSQFNDFVNTESLIISALGDLSVLDEYFPNLKTLSIHRYDGKSIAAKKFQFDSLQNVYISDAENLEKMDAFADCIAIENIKIRSTPNLKHFPKFHKNNTVKELLIDHGITFRKTYSKDYFKAIKRLSKLEKLTLANIYSVTEVPSYLPKSIQYLEINSWAVHNRTTKISNLKHLKKYKKLTELRLYNIELDSVATSFSGISLKGLYLDTVHNLKDVSWVFTFDSIASLRIRDCNYLRTIKALLGNSVISKIDIDKAMRLTSIDALFQLDNLESLEVRNCPELLLPSTAVMYRIPHIMMAGNDYHLYRENGIWEKIEYR